MLLTHNPIESARDCRRYHHWCEAIHKLVEREASCWTDPKRSLNLIRRLHNATERTNMVETDHKAEASKRLSTLLERLNADVQNIHAQQVEEATQKLKAAEDKLNRKMQNPGGAEPEPEDPAVAKARLRKYIEQKTREFASKAKHAYSKFLSAKKLTWGDKGTRWRTWDKSRCAFGLVSARKGEWSFEMAVKELQQGRDEGESIIVDEFLEDFEREHRILYDMVFFCFVVVVFLFGKCVFIFRILSVVPQNIFAWDVFHRSLSATTCTHTTLILVMSFISNTFTPPFAILAPVPRRVSKRSPSHRQQRTSVHQ